MKSDRRLRLTTRCGLRVCQSLSGGHISTNSATQSKPAPAKAVFSSVAKASSIEYISISLVYWSIIVEIAWGIESGSHNSNLAGLGIEPGVLYRSQLSTI